ncbi:MAG: class I SAM-dependent methyltransferase [Chlamydiales bacterium]|nr:class I SAM-dependent methyltransferase [Chlamydiales bacterium]
MKKKRADECKMEFGTDELGHEILLKDGKFQVMMEWERPYMEACIDALKPSGDVLEIGFGCGYSAKRIQDYKPKSHTIIEYHPVVAERARKWAENYPNVKIVEDTWQNALDKLGAFDAIFFDDYPLQSEEELLKLDLEKSRASSIVNAGRKKMEELEKELSHCLKGIKYSDEDIEQFFTLAEKEGRADPKLFIRFFAELEEKGGITKKQREWALKRLKEKGLITDKQITEFLAEKKPPAISAQMRSCGDRLFDFLDRCLKKHMRVGSRFSCFLTDATSKFEDEKFFNMIITNPLLEYHEHRIPIVVPPNCKYYTGDAALVVTIIKIG